MSAEVPARRYLSVRGLDELRRRLSERDLAIIAQVSELRLMSGGQIKVVHFPASAHESELAAARSCHRSLARLTNARLLARLDRRIGGVRAGSNSFVYALGPAGQRLIGEGGPRKRLYEPTGRFVDHTLATSQLVVDIVLAARRGRLQRIELQAEPRCWREFSRVGHRILLRPDLFVALTDGRYDFRWFIEIDRASESLPVILRKCRVYAAYYQSGQEQSRHDGIFPRICWIAPDERRAQGMRLAIARDRQLPQRLFIVTSTEHALDALTGRPA